MFASSTLPRRRPTRASGTVACGVAGGTRKLRETWFDVGSRGATVLMSRGDRGLDQDDSDP